MKKSLKGTRLFSLAVTSGFAATLLFQGTFNAHDQVALFGATVSVHDRSDKG
jgi:hypothetical protein